MLVLLLGLRASGKSTVGPLLAKALASPFVDLDNRTRDAMGTSTVREAFTTKGEAAFRLAEATCLKEVLEQPHPMVVALGGGTPTAPGAAAMIQAARGMGAPGQAQSRQGVTVYLRALPQTLQDRLRSGATQGSDAQRPPLLGASAIDEVPLIFLKRDPLYMSLADVIVRVDGLTPEVCVEEIVRAIRR